MHVPDGTQTNGRRWAGKAEAAALASSVVPIALFLVSPEVGGGWGYSRLGILEVVFSSYTYLLGTKLISSHTQTKV